jgi:predicted nucleic acid-binding protein
MNLVLDTNIIISGIITPNGTISNLIFNNDLKKSKLINPDFLLTELINKFEKIKYITKLQANTVQELIFRFTKRLDFIDDDLIDHKHQMQAYKLIRDIDKKDLLFVAFVNTDGLQTINRRFTADKWIKEKGKIKFLRLFNCTK